MFLVAFVVALILLNSCSDAHRGKTLSWGDEFRVEMVSGGRIVRTWTSTGKVASETNSDGYYFKDKETGKYIEVSGEVIITKL